MPVLLQALAVISVYLAVVNVILAASFCNFHGVFNGVLADKYGLMAWCFCSLCYAFALMRVARWVKEGERSEKTAFETIWTSIYQNIISLTVESDILWRESNYNKVLVIEEVWQVNDILGLLFIDVLYWRDDYLLVYNEHVTHVYVKCQNTFFLLLYRQGIFKMDTPPRISSLFHLWL